MTVVPSLVRGIRDTAWECELPKDPPFLRNSYQYLNETEFRQNIGTRMGGPWITPTELARDGTRN